MVVEAGGAWTSVTPGSQQYWLQAFNNVLLGRWKKIEAGYGRAVLGYFGRTPLPPDPEVVKIAAEQLKTRALYRRPPRGGARQPRPGGAGPRGAQPASDRGEHLPGGRRHRPRKAMELNEGIRFLTGKAKISLPLKKKAEPAKAAPLRRAPAQRARSPPSARSSRDRPPAASRSPSRLRRHRHRRRRRSPGSPGRPDQSHGQDRSRLLPLRGQRRAGPDRRARSATRCGRVRSWPRSRR